MKQQDVLENYGLIIIAERLILVKYAAVVLDL